MARVQHKLVQEKRKQSHPLFFFTSPSLVDSSGMKSGNLVNKVSIKLLKKSELSLCLGFFYKYIFINLKIFQPQLT